MSNDELAVAVATLAAHIHAATWRLLTLIAELDRRGWRPTWDVDTGDENQRLRSKTVSPSPDSAAPPTSQVGRT